MAKTTLILISFVTALAAAVGNGRGTNPAQSPAPSPGEASQKGSTSQERGVMVTIATVGSFLEPPTDRYKVGDQIPVTINMTNTTTAPQYVCLSSDLYQDLPKLTRNGELVPFMNWQSYERLNAQRNHVCQEQNLPEMILLKPNEPKKVDWFVLVDSGTSTGAEAWYDALPPGKYELTIQRRLGCCDGPMIESNKINFEVVP
ncbi:MAG: hypothetical protein ND895_00235 [Pyrinomonadaceae bacterium]|nr:hypothetical protein [Pyrinomonadaceae bacterium]